MKIREIVERPGPLKKRMTLGEYIETARSMRRTDMITHADDQRVSVPAVDGVVDPETVIVDMSGTGVASTKSFRVMECNALSLEGMPHVTEEIRVRDNRIKDLRGLDCAQGLKLLSVNNNELKSLQGCPRRCDSIFSVHTNPIVDVVDEILRFVDFANEIIVSADQCQPGAKWLRLFNARSCKYFKLAPFSEASDHMKRFIQVFNRHLCEPKGAAATLALQNELLDIGLEEFASA